MTADEADNKIWLETTDMVERKTNINLWRKANIKVHQKVSAMIWQGTSRKISLEAMERVTQ